MRIPLHAKGLLDNLLSKAGAQILQDFLIEKAQHFENQFNKDQVPEENRIGAKCSVVTKEYYYTLERLPNQEWALSGFEFKPLNTDSQEEYPLQQKATC